MDNKLYVRRWISIFYTYSAIGDILRLQLKDLMSSMSSLESSKSNISKFSSMRFLFTDLARTTWPRWICEKITLQCIIVHHVRMVDTNV